MCTANVGFHIEEKYEENILLSFGFIVCVIWKMSKVKRAGHEKNSILIYICTYIYHTYLQGMGHSVWAMPKHIELLGLVDSPVATINGIRGGLQL